MKKYEITEKQLKNAIVINETTDYSDYCYGVIDCATGKPIEYIDLSCSGSSIETEYLFDRIKENNLYSSFCEKPCEDINGKKPIDIADYNWYGGIISEIVLAGLKENRDYNILHTYGMESNDGFYEYFNK